MAIFRRFKDATRPLRHRLFAPPAKRPRNRRPRKQRTQSWGYWGMTKTLGVRFAFSYFFQSHLFDLVHGTDTCATISQEQYIAKPTSFEDGTFYFASWTSEILNSFNVVRKLLGSAFSQYTFIDVGCGKGKVPLVWQREMAKAGIASNVIGVDYYAPLITIAEQNHLKLFTGTGQFHVADAATYDFSEFGRKLIIYLYNPFNDVILGRLTRNLDNVTAIVIYNNPVHASVLMEHGYRLIYEKMGRYGITTTMIFTNDSGIASLA